MIDWLENTRPIARKQHNCTACECWHDSDYTVDDCITPRQRMLVQKAAADGWRILPGQRYIYARGIHDGEFFTVRARLDMDEVCRALDLYEPA